MLLLAEVLVAVDTLAFTSRDVFVGGGVALVSLVEVDAALMFVDVVLAFN